MPKECHLLLVSTWISSHWLQIFEDDHVANFLSTVCPICQIHVSSLWGQGWQAGQHQMLCLRPDKLGQFIFSHPPMFQSHCRKPPNLSGVYFSLLKPHWVSPVTYFPCAFIFCCNMYKVVTHLPKCPLTNPLSWIFF